MKYLCGYCSSWCKIGDELYSFVSRGSHFGCWSRNFDCNTASLHQAMRSIDYILLFLARWFAAIGAFRSSLLILFRLLDGVREWWYEGTPSTLRSTSKVTPSWDKRIKFISYQSLCFLNRGVPNNLSDTRKIYRRDQVNNSASITQVMQFVTWSTIHYIYF